MDLSIGNLWSALMISVLGAALFLYGKKAQRLYPLLAGIAMCIYPYLISDWMLLWGITVGILLLLYYFREQ